ncbi:LLM class flavin-dependent oxidoreductase [Nocardia transvalensis]|uniref:LLM class flavin-dependent oxidoreductase n=1 Tax=Nocardia transvalensis TaxID=37333 RepID=UPI001894BEF6|nr:LLM class flavin-dependent oxidoreductase [Nocardia transvalensis]MBF6330727.1 LLM class flavin-dependent oxidoreductase [Nocardia transvalensis]
MPLNLGVSLPTFVGHGGTIGDIPALARHAEQAGLDTVWVGDHLSAQTPFLDSVVALAGAAAVTERIHLGFGVMLLALRQQAWAAKQLASLQYLSGDRVLLGVGAGGHPDEWPAGGVPYTARGRRTDAMLRALPDLFAGRSTPLLTVPGKPTLTLDPPVPAPPLWIGGMSDRALRRAIDHGAGWLASLLTPDELAARTAALSALAKEAGTPTPQIGTTVFAALTTISEGERQGHDRVVRFLRSLTGEDGLSEERANRLVISGPPEKLADRLSAYAHSGATTFIINLSGPDLPHQYALLAQTRELLSEH